MPRSGSGDYQLPSGPGFENPVISGTIIESLWANTTMTDLAQALGQSLDRLGRGAMLAPLRGVDGTVSQPSFSFSSDTDTGMWRAPGELNFSVDGVQVLQLTPGGAAGPGGDSYVQDAPADGAIYGRQDNIWVPVSGGGSASVLVQDSEPTSPLDNTLWVQSTTGRLSLWYTDPDSQQWMELGPGGGGGTGGGGGGATIDGHIVQDEGVDLTQATRLDFVGAGVTAAGDALVTTVTINADVVGPGTAVDANFVQFDGTTGKLVQDGGFNPASFDAAGQAAAVQANLTSHIGQGGSAHSLFGVNLAGFTVGPNNTAIMGNYLLQADATGGTWVPPPTGGSGTINAGENVGGGDGQIYAGVNGDLIQFRTLTSTDTSVDFTINGNVIDISATGAGGGQSNVGENLMGGGAGVYAGMNGVNLTFRTINGGTGVTAVENATNITLNLDETQINHVNIQNSGTVIHADLDTFYNTLTTNGDLITRDAGAFSRIGVGTENQVLTVVSGSPAWAASSGGYDTITEEGANPLQNGVINFIGPAVTASQGAVGVTDVTIPLFVGGTAGASGTVPPSTDADVAAQRLLRADGTWAVPAGGGDVVGPATATPGNLAVYADGTGKVIADGGPVPTGGSGVQVQDEAGTPFTAETLQYLGAGVTAVQNGTVAEITIPGGGTGSGLTYQATNAALITGVAGTLYDVTVPSGGTVFTLPTTNDSADRIAVRCAVSSSRLNGLLQISNPPAALPVERARLFIGDELLLFASTGAAWYVEEDGRKPCVCAAQDTTGAAGTLLDSTLASWQLASNNVLKDNGDLLDVPGNRIVARRASPNWYVYATMLGPTSSQLTPPDSPADLRVDIRRDISTAPSVVVQSQAVASLSFGRASAGANAFAPSVASDAGFDIQLRLGNGISGGQKLSSVSGAPTFGILETL